jgi:hypothetical protein
MTPRNCAKCQGSMEPGFVLDRNYDRSEQNTWVDGAPEPSVWLGGVKTRKKEKIPIATYRCTTCGYLESYANSER